MLRMYRNLILATLCLASELIFALPTPALRAAPLQQAGDPVIAAAGDVANCSNEEDFLTGYLLDSIDGLILGLGDLAYEVGSVQEFNDCYGPAWGRHKERTRPAPGNHEYGKGNANDYFTWWGDIATPTEPGCRKDCGGYYSFNVGAWHLIALNSEIPDGPDSPQQQWLRADLAANPTVCTLAYWHKPRFSSGHHMSGSGQGLWQALYEYGADVVLVGHDHDYERFAPQGPNGEYEPDRGIREFVVGTGGALLRDFRFIQPNSEVRNSETHGILKMTLHPTSYDWEFIPIPGKTFTDKGSAPCVNPGNLPPPPATTTMTTTTTTTTPAPTTATAPAQTNTAVVAPAALPNSGTYTVQAGDTLSLIGLRYGLDWQDLARINQLASPDIIEVGQVLRLSAGASQAPANTATTAPAAAPAASQPQASTPVTSTAPLTTTRADTQTTAPTATGTTTATTTQTTVRTHTVASGDTIIGIALQYNLDWQALLTLNGLKPDSILQIGQQIRLQ
jgi:LysM repeat protein